ncbi:MAG: hypothetical protein D3923_02965 [Candidatus Electrothrix sp. AR3]|nr:hypothetical protein [Candidatus Electrothrix sp. AR3]
MSIPTKISFGSLLLLFIFCSSLAAAQSIELDKDHYSPGEILNVYFTSSDDFADNAWIGIIPSHVKHGSESLNDKHDLSYQYLKKRTSGTLTFKAPEQEDSYDLRMHDTDNNGREVNSVSFTVAISESSKSSSMHLNKNNFLPGEEINVQFTSPDTFTDNAWIGIIPSNVQHGSELVNDKFDLSYQYLKKRTSGTLTFKAPTKEGSYDFRMHDTDNDGREVASVSFTVTSSKLSELSSLQLNKNNFSPEEEIKVHFTVSGNFADNAWIGIIPSHVQHGSESVNDKFDLSYQYLKKRTSGTLTFKAPTEEGSYDFRMHDTDNNGREITSVSFKVSK